MDAQLKSAEISDWPDHRRWAYGGPDYLPLRGIRIGDENGTLTFRFALTFTQRIRLFFGGSVYVSVMAGNGPLQPLRIDCAEPDFVNEFRRYYDHEAQDLPTISGV